ncbi:hypothetical protein [Sporisorium scitamineum]|uniref:Uncharacterized protein n=1 Tax=Sporisorium scitamineum TaxID=49012 RepID=A0A0F7RY03_9BASI|nr:hypothetical protein [Sporisorium scitamineum]
MASTNIFNINETSFMFGIGSTEHVVMPAMANGRHSGIVAFFQD